MIIEKVILDNFGVYRGRQEIELAPPSSENPIILIGGLNGTGKTTLLDALQLVLFGKLARCSNRGALGYHQYLLKSIHRGVSPERGAAIELIFRLQTEGKTHRYHITRRWQLDGKNVKEVVSVLKNGEPDRVLAEHWDEQVGRFVQPDILELFFFDGEKIADIAGAGHAPRFLKTAINSLLGIENVERLQEDLAALTRRKKIAKKDPKTQNKYLEVEKELKRLRMLKEKLNGKRAALQNDCDGYLKILRRLERKYQTEGGALIEQRDQILKQREKVAAQFQEKEKALVELAAGPAPLLLVEKLLYEVRDQGKAELQAKANRRLVQELGKRDQQVLQWIQEMGASELTLPLNAFLAEDRKKRSDLVEETEAFLDFDEGDLDQINALLGTVLPAEREKATYLIREYELMETELADLDRKLANMPAPESFQNMVKDMESARAKIDEHEIRLSAIDEELASFRRRIEQTRQQLARLLENVVEGEFEEETDRRMVREAENMTRLMTAFKERVVGEHLHRLEAYILESYQSILRKKGLVGGIEIDPKTLELSLIDGDGRELGKDRLSAGELQLLAVAMVWGLARASGRPLPCVIDTPLGRLDASHRKLLMTRYYPFASHQVILLSTDKEVDHHFFETIDAHVGHAYHLRYDDATSATTVHKGYFQEVALVN